MQVATGLRILLLGLGCTACGGGTPQKIYATYITGRINMTNVITVDPGVSIVVEYSTDGFANVAGNTILNNDQGLLTLPYRINFDSTDGDYVQLRAYQDPSSAREWVPGDGSGRYDGTDSGNAAFLSVHRVVDYSCSGGTYNSTTGSCTTGFDIFSSAGQQHFISDADIALDSTTGL